MPGGGLYNKLKGVVEENINALNFPLRTATYRPACIYGTFHSNLFLNAMCSALRWPVLGKYQTINIDVLALAMLHGALEQLDRRQIILGGQPLVIYEGEDLLEIAA
jgi:hypothetical protein